MLNIAYDAHDLDRTWATVVVVDIDVRADRILARPESPRHGLAYNRDRNTVAVVVFIDHAPAPEGDLHRAKIVRRRYAPLRLVRVSRRNRSAHDGKIDAVKSAAHGQE